MNNLNDLFEKVKRDELKLQYLEQKVKLYETKYNSLEQSFILFQQKYEGLVEKTTHLETDNSNLDKQLTKALVQINELERKNNILTAKTTMIERKIKE